MGPPEPSPAVTAAESSEPKWLQFLKQALPGARLIRIGIGIVAVFAVYEFVIYLGRIGVYDLAVAQHVFPVLLYGFYITLELIAVVIPLGFTIGFFVGWARTTRYPALRGAGALFVDFFRSMPPIVLIAFAFLIGLLALRSTPINPFLAHQITLWLGVIALAFHSASYQAEIVRAGILSVPAGQTEAADAVGMSRIQTMFRVVLPQAFRVSLPSLGNEFSSVIKDTSLLSAIGWLELSGIALVQVYAELRVYLYAAIVIWLEVAVLYFIVTYALNVAVRSLENVYKVPGLEITELEVARVATVSVR